MYRIFQLPEMFKLILFLVFLVFNCSADQFEDECGLESSPPVTLVKWGPDAIQHEFPWHVGIFAREYDQFEVMCGGSLVKSNFVISAAHCFSADGVLFLTNLANYRVVAGTHLASWTSQDDDKQTSKVRKVYKGSGYRGIAGNYDADIAMVQLTNSFYFSDKVRIICLQLETGLDNWYMNPGITGKVPGWGLTEWEMPSNTLRFLTVPVIGDEDCRYDMPPLYRKYLIADKVCAGLRDGSSMCRGDSGGGLVFQYQDRWYLCGVLSSAPTMENTNNPSTSCRKTSIVLYTNVLKYKFWLSYYLRELQRTAYASTYAGPGAACSRGGFPGDCRNFCDCPTAMKEADLGFPPPRCLNSDPARRVICCVSPQRPSASRITSGYDAFEYGKFMALWSLMAKQ